MPDHVLVKWLILSAFSATAVVAVRNKVRTPSFRIRYPYSISSYHRCVSVENRSHQMQQHRLLNVSLLPDATDAQHATAQR